MTGLLLIAIAMGWFWVVMEVCGWVGRRVKSKWVTPATALTFLILVPLPVIDEIVGGLQFSALCEKNAVLWVDAGNAKGKTVRLEITPKGGDEKIEGTALRILRSHYSYRVVDSNEEIARYETYTVRGGWLIRALGISNSDAPLTTGRSACAPEGRGMLDRTYGFTLIN
jgi:hypothetical protein